MAKSITVLVYDDFGFLDIVGPADVFTIANQRARKTLYKLRVTVVGRQRSVQAESGMRLCVDSDISKVTRTHTLLIAGGSGFHRALAQRRTIAEIIRLARSAQRVISICTGAFLLAEAGLLADRLSVSERHFVRLFRARTSTTPARWVERIRIDAVRERLERSSDSIETVAIASGFASVETMRQAFRRVVGVAPGDYRKHHSFTGSVQKPETDGTTGQ